MMKEMGNLISMTILHKNRICANLRLHNANLEFEVW